MTPPDHVEGRRDTPFVRVSVPAYRGPAIHVCRFLVSAPRDVFSKMSMPFPKLDPWAPWALASERLLLPEGSTGRFWNLLPEDVPTGSCPLWDEDPESPLLVPLSVVRERQFDQEWRTQEFCTAKSLGVPVEDSTLAQVAWAVLCRLDRAETVRLLSQLSQIADRYRTDPTVLESLVHQMKAPPLLAGPLLAAARGGQPLLYSRAVTWILRELLSADDDERADRASWRPSGFDDVSLVAHAWFPTLRTAASPRSDEVLLATWLLHQVFHGAEDTTGQPDHILSMVTSLGFRFGDGSAWFQMLDRWRSIWLIADDHPALSDTPVPPSTLRTIYESKLGLAPVAWLAGCWAICVRLWMELGGELPRTAGVPDEFFRLPMEDDPIQMSGEFVVAFRRECVASLAVFAQEARAEAGPSYDGIGTLPQSDSLATRNHPVIELPDGTFKALSVDLVAERAVSLHRFMFGGARSRNSSAMGKLFEAYVADLIDRLRGRHLIFTEADIAAFSGSSQRGDALIGYGEDYLAVETATQTLSRAIAAGSVPSIRNMAERYQHEADQAVATLKTFREQAQTLGVPAPVRATHLVVTETPLPHTPAFVRSLHDVDPTRTPKFVCGVHDFEFLVELGVRGWSVPGAVLGWQQTPNAAPLRTTLTEMTRTLPPMAAANPSLVDAWITDAPRVNHRSARGTRSP